MFDIELSKLLLEWYAVSGRELPWRVKGGPHPDPYVILVSEFMLQQTTVKTVIPYFHRFMQRFPSLSPWQRQTLRKFTTTGRGSATTPAHAPCIPRRK